MRVSLSILSNFNQKKKTMMIMIQDDNDNDDVVLHLKLVIIDQSRG